MADNIVITAELKDLVSGHLKDITAQVNKLEGSLANVGRRSSSGGSMLGSVFGGNLLAQGVSMATSAIKDFSSSTLDSLVNYEYFSSSLKAMLKGDAMMGKALENQLVTLAKTTPFSLVDVQQGTKQLIAYGFSAGSIVENMKMLGDVSAGVGKPLGEVAYLYGTLKTQGRAFSKDINQFTSAGIPIIKELAKQFNVTDSNVMKLVESGKVGFAEVEKAFKSMTSEGSIFFNLMAEQSKTAGGKISALGDSWEQLKVNIGKSQKGIIAGTTDFLDKTVSQLGGFFSNQNFVDEATGGKSRGSGTFSRWSSFFGLNPTDDAKAGLANEKYAGVLQDLLKNKTGSHKDISSTSSFISAELNKIKAERKIIKSENLVLAINKNKMLSDEGGGGLRYRQAEYKNKNKLIELADKQDMLIYALDQLKGAAKVIDTKVDPITNVDPITKGTTNPSSLEALAKANRPTQTILNIENLVREINNTYQNVQKGMELTGEQIAKVLIGVANDVSATNPGN